MSRDEKIAALEAEVAALKKRVRDADDELAIVDVRASAEAATHSRFVPVAATDCYGVKPCLHSTPADRIAAGCLHGIWEGTYGTSGTHYKHEIISTRNGTLNITYDRPIAPIEWQRYKPAMGEQCDLADVWALSRFNAGRHVTDATEKHWHQRLKGLRHSLWLFLGSSIDHGGMKVACDGFGAPRTQTVEGNFGMPSLAYPPPSGLTVSYCHILQLNLTLAYVGGHGICTTAVHYNASLQPLRFREIAAQLRLMNPGWYGSPSIITFGGIEWDFKVFLRAVEQRRDLLPLPFCCRLLLTAQALLCSNRGSWRRTGSATTR